MLRTIGSVLIAYGAFLLLAGVIGWIATGEASTSALLNGGIFGSLMMALGVLVRHGRMWTYPAAMSATGIFTLTFAWRGVLQWQHVITDDPSRVWVAILLSVMFAASAVVLRFLVRHYRH